MFHCMVISISIVRYLSVFGCTGIQNSQPIERWDSTGEMCDDSRLVKLLNVFS